MEKLKITLKECCLDCEDFYATGPFGLGCATEREIGCAHMPVCYKYREETKEKTEEESIKVLPCRYCCGKARFIKSTGDSKLCFAVCESCGSSVMSNRGLEGAIELWNKRARY